ncbi:MAG TPA: GNAT family protein [Kiritimatiellia bacterium]|nr:GNAT family protein [Kiritimatiellia bacterium]
MMDRLHPADSRTAAFLHRLRAMHPRDCLRIFCIQHIDHLVFSMDMSDVPEPPPAWGELTIECKMIGADDLGYCAFLERELVCRVCARRHVLLLAQFGFGNPFVLGDGYTSQPHRGRGIFTKVLRYALNDLKKNRGVNGEVMALVVPENTPSIHAFLRAGFRTVARLRAIRCGPFLMRRSRTVFDAGDRE